jgi:hypothetical protein
VLRRGIKDLKDDTESFYTLVSDLQDEEAELTPTERHYKGCTHYNLSGVRRGSKSSRAIRCSGQVLGYEGGYADVRGDSERFL